MAVVKFSADLRSTIINNARELFKTKIDAAVNDFNPSWGDRIFSVAYKPYMEGINALPKNWFNWTEEVSTSQIAGVTLPQAVNLKLSERMPIPVIDLSKTGHMPISFNKDGYYPSSLRTPDDPLYDDIKTEVLAYKNKITLATERKDRFVAGVEELINAHNTLAPALKAWQPLWDLLPEQTKERHLLEVKRADKVNVQLATDLNALTATIVASKIGV